MNKSKVLIILRKIYIKTKQFNSKKEQKGGKRNKINVIKM